MGLTGTEEDTYVAVLERAPQKNEEVMTVFTKGVQCQQMVYLSVHGPRVGKGPTLRMAAYNNGKVCILRLVAIYRHGQLEGYKRTQQHESAQRRIIILQVLLVREWSKSNA